jgi:predicted nucleic acid-binding protein
MATTAVERGFVDTNVLVYSVVPAAPLASAALARLTAWQAAGVERWISRQVMREYLAVLSRPQTFTKPVPMPLLLDDLTRFESTFLVAEDGPAVTAQLRALLAATSCGGKQVHDANIVATMLAHGIPKLLTHNVADFNRFAACITVVPLVP